MAETQSRPRLVRFGAFEADLWTGELRKDGVKLKFSGQPFQVLAILLERPGDVVTREELQRRLWPDTFVDVDHNLNTIINKIRETLGDSADTPCLVETLPRRGYRFIGRIESGEPEPIEPEPPKPFWRWKSSLTASAAFLLFLTLSGYLLKWQPARHPADPSTIRSIAVLPLANLSADPSQQ